MALREGTFDKSVKRSERGGLALWLKSSKGGRVSRRLELCSTYVCFVAYLFYPATRYGARMRRVVCCVSCIDIASESHRYMLFGSLWYAVSCFYLLHLRR